MKLQVTELKEIIVKIADVAKELDFEIYLVGGYVRDLYLNRPSKDLDFVVVGDAPSFAEQFKEKTNAGKIVVFPKFGTAMLHYKDHQIEFVSARTEFYDENTRKPKVVQADLKSDISRRDFTINTLAMKISPNEMGEVVDFYNGIADIDEKIIRTPLDPDITYSDDPLRIMRAIRFATVLNFKIDPASMNAIAATKDRLSIISQERITEEFRKMMLAEKPSIGLYLMQDLGLLPIVFPELEKLSGQDQRQDFHHKDVFKHTLQVIDNVARRSDSFELRLAALLHDIAKPQTKKFVDGIGWTFHGHEDLGAHMSKRIGKRMRLPQDTIKYLQKIVRLHLRPMALVEDHVTDSAIRRLMVEAGEEIDDLMILCRADITSKNPGKVKRFLKNFDIVEEKMQIVEAKDKLRNFKPAITGDKIMSELKITPGPLIGKIKKEITDAILDGIIPNESESCLEYLHQIKHTYID